MSSVRIIPCLLVKEERGLYKGTRYDQSRYLGDVLNAVRIFNEKEVDELMVVDILANLEQRSLSPDFVRRLANESLMPVSVGGGIRRLDQAKALIGSGAEKIVLNSFALENPSFVEELASSIGSQGVVVSIDVRKARDGSYEAYTHSGTRRISLDPLTLARQMESAGAGELLIKSIDRDGTMEGLDVHITRQVAETVRLPVIACGGAGSLAHLADAVKLGKASAVAAGSLFVFHGRRRAVLINFPGREELEASVSSHFQ